MVQRARHGDAPRWIVVHVLVGVLGVPAAVFAYAVLVALLQWKDAPSPGPVVTVVDVLVLLSLFRSYLARRPVTTVERTYYRLALVFIGLFGVLGTWLVAPAVAVVLLAHSFLLDRSVQQTEEPAPWVRP